MRLNFVLATVQIVHNSFPETWLKSLRQGDRRDLLASVHCDQGKEEVRPQPISTEVKEAAWTVSRLKPGRGRRRHHFEGPRDDEIPIDQSRGKR